MSDCTECGEQVPPEHQAIHLRAEVARLRRDLEEARCKLSESIDRTGEELEYRQDRITEVTRERDEYDTDRYEATRETLGLRARVRELEGAIRPLMEMVEVDDRCDESCKWCDRVFTLRALLEPQAQDKMDAPGAPVCSCGRPSRLDISLGWCGECTIGASSVTTAALPEPQAPEAQEGRDPMLGMVAAMTAENLGMPASAACECGMFTACDGSLPCQCRTCHGPGGFAGKLPDAPEGDDG